MTSMASMAHAMIKAGLVSEQKVVDSVREEKEAEEEYKKLSEQIVQQIRNKRQLQDLQSLARDGGSSSSKADYFFLKAKKFIELVPLNLSSKANQTMVQDMLKAKLNEIESNLKPLFTKSRKLESKWGFQRHTRDHR
jgi:hypothetical protein